MQGTIQNRDSFLNTIAQQLGRLPKRQVERTAWKYQPQKAVLQNASQDELVQVLQNQCQNIHTACVMTTTEQLPETLHSVVEQFGKGSVIAWKDERFAKYGLTQLMQEEWPKQEIAFYEWNEGQAEENIKQAEQANIGITISEITLAESGTAVLFSDKNRGRSVSFLPNKSIILIPKSSIVPRMTQAAQKIHQKIANGEQVASCVNFITGPSNSADIEMVLIVGVHGPVKATYIIIEDQ